VLLRSVPTAYAGSDRARARSSLQGMSGYARTAERRGPKSAEPPQHCGLLYHATHASELMAGKLTRSGLKPQRHPLGMRLGAQVPRYVEYPYGLSRSGT
jgi:hypothetical protein